MGTAMVHRWAQRFGVGHYRITVQPISEKDSETAWATSYWETAEEWAVIDLPADDSMPVDTLELLVLHELAHGLLKVVGGDAKSVVTEATCNRIARLAKRDYTTPLMNEHAASAIGDAWYGSKRKRAAEVDRRAWLPIVTDGLPAEERELITLLYWEGVSIREASYITGIPRETLVRKRDKALKRLLSYFNALDTEFGDDDNG